MILASELQVSVVDCFSLTVGRPEAIDTAFSPTGGATSLSNRYFGAQTIQCAGGPPGSAGKRQSPSSLSVH